ncbi:MAG: helix-turn-helix transcriptional regulator [Pseudomonadota bacterium]
MKHAIQSKASRLLRITEIIAPNGPVPVGRSTWWEGVKSGRFPQPIKLGPRITVWREEDIEALLANGTEDDA